MSADDHVNEWAADFEAVRREQLRGWMKATPEQKLQWLEDAQRLVQTARRVPRDDQSR